MFVGGRAGRGETGRDGTAWHGTGRHGTGFRLMETGAGLEWDQEGWGRDWNETALLLPSRALVQTVCDRVLYTQ